MRLAEGFQKTRRCCYCLVPASPSRRHMPLGDHPPALPLIYVQYFKYCNYMPKAGRQAGRQTALLLTPRYRTALPCPSLACSLSDAG